MPTLSDAKSGSLVRMAGGTAFWQLGRLAIQMASLVILARFLGPSAYGLVAIVLVFVGIGEVIRDGGLSVAAVSREDLTDSEVGNLFWLSVSIGVGLAFALTASSPMIASIFGDARLKPLCAAMSPIFIINASASQFRADLARRFRLISVSAAEAIAQLIGLAVALAVCLWNATYWAIVVQQLVVAVLAAGALMLMSRRRMPLPRRDGTSRHLVSFGFQYLATQLVVYIGQNVTTFLVGLRLGSYDVGLFNRASQVVSLPIGQLTAPATNLALPALSRVDSEQQDGLLTKAAVAICYGFGTLVVPGVIGAHVAIRALLGAHWSAADPMLIAVLIAGFFQCANLISFWTFLSRGRAAENLQFSVMSRLVSIGILSLASGFGMHWLLVAYVVTSAGTTISALAWIHVRLGLRVRHIGSVILRSAALVGGAIGVSMLLLHSIGFYGAWWGMLLGLAVFGVLGFGARRLSESYGDDLDFVLSAVVRVARRNR